MRVALVGSIAVYGMLATFIHASTFNTVAVTGQPAAIVGGTYGPLTHLSLADSGHFAFRSSVGGGTASPPGSVIYSNTGHGRSLVVVAQSGQAVPGSAGSLSYSHLSPPVISANGAIAFDAELLPPLSPSAGLYAMFSGASTSPQLIAKTGDAGPMSDTTVRHVFQTYAVNDAGSALFRGTLKAAAEERPRVSLFLSEQGKPLQLVARDGDAVAGSPALLYDEWPLGLPQWTDLNDRGDVARYVSFDSAGSGLILGPLSSPRVVVQSGAQVPMLSDATTYGYMNRFRLRDDGAVHFEAYLEGPAVTTDSKSALFTAYPNGTVQMHVRTGGPAPFASFPNGTAVPSSATMFHLSQSTSNDAGDIAFMAFLSGPGINFSKNGVLCVGAPSDIRAVARFGDAVDLGDSIRIAGIDQVTLNDRGQLAFFAILSGDVTTANRRALMSFDPRAGMRTVVRNGDTIDIGDGVMKTVSGFDTSIYLSGLADDGTLAFTLAFTDGTQGLFTTIVPEPAALSSLALLLAARRRRRTAIV